MGKPDIRKLKDTAMTLTLKGKFDKALEVYQEIVQADPRDIKIWVKIGDLYRKVNRPEQAIDIYAKAARSFAMNGFLMQAISVNKMILEIDPSHQETQQALAELYAKKDGPVGEGGSSQSSDSGGSRAVPAASLDLLESLKKKSAQKANVSAPAPARASAPVAPPQPVVPEVEEEEATLVEPEPDDVDIEVAVTDLEPDFEPELEPEPEIAALVEPEKSTRRSNFPQFDAVDLDLADNLFDSIMNQDEIDLSHEAEDRAGLVLPNIPLFSSLAADEFTGILERLQLRRFDVGDRIIREGEKGDSFYIIARGSAKVMKKDPTGKEVFVAEVGEGSFFGEFAYFNESHRHASVLVSKEMDALEISRQDLKELTGQFPRVEEVLQQFYRDRLLGSLLAISPLFKPFTAGEKRELLRSFERISYEAGSIVIKQGAEGDGLYLILSGEVVVNVKTPEGSIVEVAMLAEGSFFGEISLITDKPTTANCIAADDLEVLRMPRRRFKETILTHPQILEIVADYGDKRRRSNAALMAGGEEGLAKAGMV